MPVLKRTWPVGAIYRLTGEVEFFEVDGPGGVKWM